MAISKHATAVTTIGNELIVTYHQTVIVKADENKITLNFGHPDYVTRTTVKKMNEVSQEYNLGYSVKTEKGQVKILYLEPWDRVVSLKEGKASARNHGEYALVPKAGQISLTFER